MSSSHEFSEDEKSKEVHDDVLTDEAELEDEEILSFDNDEDVEEWLKRPADEIMVEIAERPTNMQNDNAELDESALKQNFDLRESFRVIRGQWKIIRRKYEAYHRFDEGLTDTNSDGSAYITSVLTPTGSTNGTNRNSNGINSPAQLLVNHAFTVQRREESQATQFSSSPMQRMRRDTDDGMSNSFGGTPTNSNGGSLPALSLTALANRADDQSERGDVVATPSTADGGASTDRVNQSGALTAADDLLPEQETFEKSPASEHILGVFDPKFRYINVEHVMCQRKSVPPYQPRNDTKFVLTCHRVEFNIGQLEPLFCRCAIYDIRHKKKLSEDFFFNINKPDMLQSLDSMLQAELSQRASGLFSISEPHPEIFLVMFIDKVLQGSHKDIMKPYEQPEKCQSDVKNIQAKAKETAGSFSYFRQPLAWGYTSIFNKTFTMSSAPLNADNSNAPEAELLEGKISFDLWKIFGEASSKEKFDIYELLSAPETIKKSTKALKGIAQVEISSATLEHAGELLTKAEHNVKSPVGEGQGFPSASSSSAAAATPSSPLSASSSSSSEVGMPHKRSFNLLKDLMREMQEEGRARSFSSASDTSELVRHYLFEETLHEAFDVIREFPISIPRAPYFNYVNTLYIYPQFVDFRKITVPNCKHPRHIAVKVVFRRDDSVTPAGVAPGEKVIFPRFGKEKSRFGLSSVSFDLENPQYLDEIKIDIPTPRENRHHLLFLFYHVRCKTEKASSSSSSSTKNAEAASREAAFLAEDDYLGKAHRQLIAYSFLRLDDEKSLSDETHELPLYKTLARNYLLDSELLDKKKKPFIVKTKFISTVYPQDAMINLFFKNSGNLTDSIESKRGKKYLEMALDSAEDSMKALREANFEVLLPHLPVLMNMLLYIMVKVQEHIDNENPSSALSGSGSIFSSPMTFSPNSLASPSASASSPLAHADSALHEAMPSSPAGASLHRVFLKNSSGDAGGVASPPTTPASASGGSRFRTRSHLNQSSGSSGGKSSENLLKLAFLTFYSLIRNSARVMGVYERGNTLLASYVQYIFANFPNASRPLYSIVCTQWLQLLKTDAEITRANSTSVTGEADGGLFASSSASGLPKGARDIRGTILRRRENPALALSATEKINGKETLKLSWFFFDLIFKSLVLYTKDEDANVMSAWKAEDVYRDSLFFAYLKKLVGKITKMLVGLRDSPEDFALAKSVNIQLALFLRDLFSVFPRAFVQSLLNRYYRCVDEKIALETDTYFSLNLKIDFMTVLADHEHFIQLNKPRPYEGGSHILAESLIEAVYEGIQCAEPAKKTRRKAISLWRAHVTKQEFDIRYQDQSQREVIAGLYFPFVDKMISSEEFLVPLEDSDNLSIGITLLFILRNVRKTYLMRWWAAQPPALQSNLLRLLTAATKALVTSKLDGEQRREIGIHFLELFRELTDSLKSQFNRSDVAQSSSDINDLDTDTYDDSDNQEVVEAAAEFLASFSQTAQKIFDKLNILRFFNNIVKPFIAQYSYLLITDLRNQRWRMILSGCLLHAELPLLSSTSRIVRECINMLCKPFDKPSSSRRFSLEADSNENIVFDTNEAAQQIKGATLDKLIERVTYHTDMDARFREIFFLTYRSFSTPNELLDKLIERFNLCVASDDSIKERVILRVFNSLTHWIDRHFHDFDNILIVRLLHFLDEDVARYKASHAKKPLSRLAIKMIGEKQDQQAVFSKQPPNSVVPITFNPREAAHIKLARYSDFNLMEWSSLEIARQITLIEYNTFREIEPKECFKNAWAKANKLELAPNIIRMTTRFNLTSGWVCNEILRENDLKLRAAKIIKFIEIGENLRVLNNFNGVNEVIAGLNNASVHRLKRTWELVPEKLMTQLQYMNDIMAARQAYKMMREELYKCEPPCIPYIGMYLTDLTFIEDGNKDFLSENENLINFNKRRKAAKVIMEIRTYQQTPYNLKEIEFLRTTLAKSVFKGLVEDEELYQLSLIHEPRK